MIRASTIVFLIAAFIGCSDSKTTSDTENIGSWKLHLELEPLGVDCHDVEFSPDGTTLLTGSSDGTAHLWDVQNGLKLTSFNCTARPTSDAIFSPDSKHIVTSGGGALEIWCANDCQRKKLLQGRDPVYSEDGSQILMWTPIGLGGSGPPVYTLVDANSFEILVSNTINPESFGEFNIYERDGFENGWASPGGDYKIRLDPQDSSKAQVFDRFANAVATIQATGGINDVAWSRDGKLVALGGRGPSTTIWRLTE